MQQIADWLEKLGMSEYAQRFAENRIDFSVLRELTDQDLKDLGVVLGDRRKMLRAIADIDGIEKNAPAAPAEATGAPRRTPVASEPIPTATPPPISAAAEVGGERRYVTVMFCDLVGSTSIAAQLDAEEWRDLVSAYLEAASTAVTDMGGHVAKKLGDGLMVLFGYPVAQENDAERAARAALSIQRALAEVNRRNADAGKPALNARIGIETGPVVVDAAGEIYGDAPNIAARVQALAEPGTVVVTARVQHQVAGLFVVEERGSHKLKGVPEPVTLYRLVRASGGGRRAGQRHLTPLVGREEEIAMLMRRWERARRGDGQLVMIVGEPGLGKSRLIEEFHPRLREVPHTWVEWRCSQLLQNTPLHPIADWGRQRFGGADVPAEQRLADLENTLALVKLDPAENAPLLAPLLDIPIPQDRAPTVEPEVLRRRQLTALTNWAVAGARTQPIVLAFEDVHWADPTTLDLLRGIAERGSLAPLFVLITARPEFRPLWSMRSHHTTISLAPLDRSQVRQMVSELAARHALPKEMVDGVTERSGGVPLFVEEVTRLLLERGIQAIPPTLQQSLTARLDRLGPAREVAQIGAVIGRDFSYPLLRAVAGTEDGPLQTALERLAEADILLVEGLPPESEYRFKHVLIQDAAYENLLKSRRQALHRRVAEVLRDDLKRAQPESVAYHLAEAGLWEKAIPYWLRAGKNAAARSAYREAIAQIRRGLSAVDTLPDSRQKDRLELDLQGVLGPCLISTAGPTSDAAVANFTRALELCERLQDQPEHLHVLHWLVIVRAVRGDLHGAFESAEMAVALAKARDDRPALVNSLRGAALTLLLRGRLTQSLDRAEQASAIFDAASGEEKVAANAAGQDAGVATLAVASWALWGLGRWDDASNRMDHALERAESIGHPHTQAYARYYAAILSALRGDPTASLEHAEACLALAEEHGFDHWRGLSRVARNILRNLADSNVVNLGPILSDLDDIRSKGYLMGITAIYFLVLQTIAAQRDVRVAKELVAAASAIVERNDERLFEAEFHRIRALTLLAKGGAETVNQAEVELLTALKIAQQQSARSLELRAATSLAQLWRDQGKSPQARELLAPVYGWFTQGFDTRDLMEAKALLGELVV